MFGGHADQQLVAVQFQMNSGERLTGGVVLGLTGKLFDLMAKPQTFIEFRASDGTHMLVARASIERVIPVEIPRSDQLSRRLAQDQTLDPHAVLGIAAGAGADQISTAYRALARKYHPDNFAGQENLPREVIDYVGAMFQRITMAYNELKPAAATGKPASPGTPPWNAAA
jgi:hypothetical protein